MKIGRELRTRSTIVPGRFVLVHPSLDLLTSTIIVVLVQTSLQILRGRLQLLELRSPLRLATGSQDRRVLGLVLPKDLALQRRFFTGSIFGQFFLLALGAGLVLLSELGRLLPAREGFAVSRSYN